MVKELHSIKKFRGTNLGILRLNKLADPNKGIKVKLGEQEVLPVSFDTYGHPIISEANFTYYKALKAIKERQGESLVPEVEYVQQYFAIKRSKYDSKEGIEKIKEFPEEEQLAKLKELLICRKRAHFIGKELSTFILYGKYAIHDDGHVYMCSYERIDKSPENKMVMDLSEVTNFQLLDEVHIPGPYDKCAICGKKFNIRNIQNFATTENERSEKVHIECLKNCIEAVNYQTASRIVDTVYLDSPLSEIIREKNEENGKERVWYKYHTRQGDLAIRFKNKVIEIKWFGNFKPFNLEMLFKEEDVTKRKLDDAKVIHAWSTADAIKYLMMVEKL